MRKTLVVVVAAVSFGLSLAPYSPATSMTSAPGSICDDLQSAAAASEQKLATANETLAAAKTALDEARTAVKKAHAKVRRASSDKKRTKANQKLKAANRALNAAIQSESAAQSAVVTAADESSLASATAQTGCALEDLYLANPQAAWGDGWGEAADPCTWANVSCRSGSATNLNLDGYAISVLPPSVGSLTELTYLNLGRNKLQTLPDEIGLLTNLTGLALFQNRLSALPASIGNLTALTYLGLSSNQLSAIPDSIGSLVNLRDEFLLNDNQLTSLPASIGNLQKVRVFSVADNQLGQLPSEVGNLKFVTRMIISGNPLTGDISPWTRPLMEADNLTNLQLAGGSYCVNVGGDTALEAWLDRVSPYWREGSC